jgi:hypothetical protein
LREVAPPFSPESVVEEFCETLRRYRVTTIVGDRYAGEWLREQFRKRGVTYTPSELTASDLFSELLPRLNTRTIALLDHPRAINQLAALERKVGRGKDVIDHPRHGKNDVANVLAGAAWIAGDGSKRRGAFGCFVIQSDGSVTPFEDRGARVSALRAGAHQIGKASGVYWKRWDGQRWV